MIPCKRLTGIFCCFFLILETGDAQDLLDYQNSLKYADYLFQTHQYQLAVAEYERVIFLAPEDTMAKLKLVRSYRYLNDYRTALEKLNSFCPSGPESLPGEFSGEYVKNMLYEGQFQKASGFLQTNHTLDYAVRSEYQLGIYIMQNRWREAGLFVDPQEDLSDKSEKFDALNSLVTEGLNTRYKIPALAASLSAVVPGTGKFYTGQWKDALFSLLFVTSASWLTCHTYMNKGLSFNTFLVGSVTLVFYSANIYGSYKSANRYNQKIHQSFRSKAEDILLDDRDR
ncbi:MAG TPA: hypothetical protein ENN61_05520 [Bacteroidaceae bacterium]|nr:hypothetical protein [Bacteroidaceae bacterium]